MSSKDWTRESLPRCYHTSWAGGQKERNEKLQELLDRLHSLDRTKATQLSKWIKDNKSFREATSLEVKGRKEGEDAYRERHKEILADRSKLAHAVNNGTLFCSDSCYSCPKPGLEEDFDAWLFEWDQLQDAFYKQQVSLEEEKSKVIGELQELVESLKQDREQMFSDWATVLVTWKASLLGL